MMYNTQMMKKYYLGQILYKVHGQYLFCANISINIILHHLIWLSAYNFLVLTFNSISYTIHTSLLHHPHLPLTSSTPPSYTIHTSLLHHPHPRLTPSTVSTPPLLHHPHPLWHHPLCPPSSCQVLCFRCSHFTTVYTNTRCTLASYILPINFIETTLSNIISASSLNSPHAVWTLVLAASSAPPLTFNMSSG